MSSKNFFSWKSLQQKRLGRRNLIRGAAGTAAGASFVLGSGLWKPLIADDGDEDEGHCGVALPIPHISMAPPPGPAHFFFPGPVDGSAVPTDPHGAEPNGRDPSTITNFEGFIGQVDLTFSGMGTDTETGMTSPYDFHTDTRFMKGVFIGSDERRHHGAFAFIWIDSILPAPAGKNLLGPHSYDPGISQSLVLWTTEIPDGGVEIDLDRGEAILHIENLCSIFDAFSVPNSFDAAHALGFVGAFLRSLRIHWSGIKTRLSFSNPTTRFTGDYVENTSATIGVTVRTPATRPPFTPAAKNGFQFIADPATTVTHFAQIGHERNGALFSWYVQARRTACAFVHDGGPGASAVLTVNSLSFPFREILVQGSFEVHDEDKP